MTDLNKSTWYGHDPKDRTPNAPAILVEHKEISAEWSMSGDQDLSLQDRINWYCKHAVVNGGWAVATQYGNQVLLVANVKLAEREGV